MAQPFDQLIPGGTAIAGDVVRISEDTWAIHGDIPVDGEVILAEYGSYEEARAVLDELSAPPAAGGAATV